MKRKGIMAEAFQKAKSGEKAKVSSSGGPVAEPEEDPKQNLPANEMATGWQIGVTRSNKLERNQQRIVSNNRDRRRTRRRGMLAPKRSTEPGAGKAEPKTFLPKKGKKKGVSGAAKTPRRYRSLVNDLMLESVYGGVHAAKQKHQVAAPKDDKKPVCQVPKPLKRSPYFGSTKERPSRILMFGDGKQWESGSRQTESDMEIVIGLDFGTSSTKVVLQDMNRRSYAVPFTDASENPYLLPARLYTQHGVYSLSEGQAVFRDIKLRLMNKDVDPSLFSVATAYLALVIRHCRGWLWHEHRDVYAREMITWGLNLGLPAASYEMDWLVERFFALALAALELADDDRDAITPDSARAMVDWAQNEMTRVKGENGDLIETITDEYFVGVFPEIAAQIYGFVRSERWDSSGKPMMMMVDVGAGTVDASIFTVTQPVKGVRRFNFLANNVEENGVINLHRERIKWLKEVIKDNNQWIAELDAYFQDIDIPTDRLQPIPATVKEYIPGMVLETKPGGDVDALFYNKRYWHQLFMGTILPVKNHKGKGLPQWRSLPFFLCGGGRDLPFYKSFIVKFNTAAQSSIFLDQAELRKPDNMEAKGLKKADFHRLSVAYGLSFEDVGTCVKSTDIPDLSVSISDWQDRYISKDIAD